MITVEAEASVLVVVTMKSVVVLGEEVITATRLEVGGLEAEVLVVGTDGAEVLEEGEAGVLLGRAVLREGQKLSCGIRKERRQNRLEIIKLMILARVSNKMMASSMTTIYIHFSKGTEIMKSEA